MKKILLITFVVLSHFTFSQMCNPATNGGVLTPTTTTQTTAVFATRTYFSFDAQSGCEYTFSTCGLSSENTTIRLYDAAFNELLLVNNNVCGNQDQMTVLINQSGTYNVYIARSTVLNSCNTITANCQVSYFKNCTFDNHECFGAQQICNDTPFSANTSNAGSYQELNTANQGCLSGGEHQTYWYYFQPVMNGTVSFTINTCGTCDYDFALWATSNCGNLGTPVRCSFAAPSGDTGLGNGAVDLTEGAGGDKYVAPLNVVAGQTYILLIDNYTANNEPFTIDFTFSQAGLLNCTPVNLPLEIIQFEGDKLGTKNLLTWKTDHEINLDKFIIEWSIDPASNNWETISVVEGKGGLTEMDYRLEHSTPSTKAINYYRISEVDLNGKTSVYSEIVAIDNSLNKSAISKMYNTLGQEVDSNYKGVIIILYSDGTTERRIN